MERRDFLKRAIKLSFSLLLLALISMIAYIYPSNLSRRKVRYVYLMDEDDLPRKGVKRVNYQYAVEDRTVGNRVFLAVTGNGLVAFSPVCTHLGCFVSWDGNRKEFICPCHGGRYSMSGQVTSGPPPRPLTQLPLRIDGGRVYLGVTS